MQKSVVALITILLCTLYAGHVQAEFMKGDNLFELLEKEIHGSITYQSGVGLGYLMGVTDTSINTLLCLPSMSNEQVTHIVYNYMQKHPELWHMSAAHSVINALHEVYPCK